MDGWDEQAEQREHEARLCQFLKWQISLTAGTTAGLLAIYLYSGFTQVIAIFVGCALYVGVLLRAHALVRQQRIPLAIAAISGGLFVIGLIFVLVVPAALPGLLPMPLLAVAIALPYLYGPALRRLLVASGVATSLMVVSANTVQLFPPMPHFALFPYVIGTGVIELTVLILILLWQYHTYLSDLLSRLRTANQSLQQIQANLEAQVHERTLKLQRQALRDPLTGLFNRRYMTEAFVRELSRADRNATTLGVVLLDLDHFKRFNDTWGHLAGDALLQKVGDYLCTHIRGSDLVCRYGGEEFILILPDMAVDQVQLRAEQVCAEIREIQISHGDQLLPPVTLSLGVAVFPEHGTSAEALLAEADRALYQAKSEGRDRVVMAAMPVLV